MEINKEVEGFNNTIIVKLDIAIEQSSGSVFMMDFESFIA